MKTTKYNTEKPVKCGFISSYGIDYLNMLLKRAVRQKEYSKLHAENQIQGWREEELTIRKAIKIAQDYANEF